MMSSDSSSVPASPQTIQPRPRHAQVSVITFKRTDFYVPVVLQTAQKSDITALCKTFYKILLGFTNRTENITGVYKPNYWGLQTEHQKPFSFLSQAPLSDCQSASKQLRPTARWWWAQADMSAEDHEFQLIREAQLQAAVTSVAQLAIRSLVQCHLKLPSEQPASTAHASDLPTAAGLRKRYHPHHLLCVNHSPVSFTFAKRHSNVQLVKFGNVSSAFTRWCTAL